MRVDELAKPLEMRVGDRRPHGGQRVGEILAVDGPLVAAPHDLEEHRVGRPLDHGAQVRAAVAIAHRRVGVHGDVIRHRADRGTRDAKVEEVKASFDAKKSEIKTYEAQVLSKKEDLRQAHYNLDRCQLYAPFTGEVSEVYVEAGGFAMRGKPVAHLVMMSPIKVDLAVSAAMSARLRRGEFFYREQELEAYVDAERALLRSLKPDLVVGDFRLSLPVSTYLEGVPLLTLANAHWSPASTCRITELRSGLFGRLPDPMRVLLL